MANFLTPPYLTQLSTERMLENGTALKKSEVQQVEVRAEVGWSEFEPLGSTQEKERN